MQFRGVIPHRGASDIEARTKKGGSSVAWGQLEGDVGSQELSVFQINRNGSTGYYVTGGARRTLKVVTRRNGYMEVNAYLRGKYIGVFKGNYTTWGNLLTEYSGQFYSSRGSKIAFFLHAAAAFE